MGIQGGKEREMGAESLYKETVAENFPNLRKELGKQIHKAKRTPNYPDAYQVSNRILQREDEPALTQHFMA